MSASSRIGGMATARELLLAERRRARQRVAALEREFEGLAEAAIRRATRRVLSWSSSAVDTAVAVVATLAAVWVAIARTQTGSGGVVVSVRPGVVPREFLPGSGPQCRT